MTNAAIILQLYCSADLRHLRSVLETEALEMVRANTNTQAFWGKLELLTAVGAELDARGALLPPPPFVDLCIEDGVRASFQVRVF